MKTIPYLCFVNQLNINTMKKELLIFAIIGIFGQLTSLYGLFISTNNDQVILSIYMFLTFSVVGVSTILFNDYLQKKEKETTE